METAAATGSHQQALELCLQSIYMEADRALCGHGGWQLVSTYSQHCVAVDIWKSMSAAQRKRPATPV